MRIKYILIMLITVVTTLNAVHSNAGEYGFQILEINTSPAMSGMGDTGAFTSGDALNFLSNPTAGIFNKSNVLTISQNFWLSDTSIISGGYSQNRRKYHWGYAFRHLGYGTLDTRDTNGEIIGEFDPLDFIGTINYAFRIGANHYFGVNGNILYQKISTASSYGFSTDLGYTWNTPVKDMKFYSGVKNLGRTSNMDKERIDLPLNFELGLVKEFYFPLYDLAFDAKTHKSSDTDWQFNIGGQVKTFEILYLRAGYKVEDDLNEFSYGLGIDYDSFNIDYAYMPMLEGFDNIHKISLSYKF